MSFIGGFRGFISFIESNHTKNNKPPEIVDLEVEVYRSLLQSLLKLFFFIH